MTLRKPSGKFMLITTELLPSKFIYAAKTRLDAEIAALINTLAHRASRDQSACLPRRQPRRILPRRPSSAGAKVSLLYLRAGSGTVGFGTRHRRRRRRGARKQPRRLRAVSRTIGCGTRHRRRRLRAGARTIGFGTRHRRRRRRRQPRPRRSAWTRRPGRPRPSRVLAQEDKFIEDQAPQEDSLVTPRMRLDKFLI